MPNGIPHCYQLDQYISIIRVVGFFFPFLFKFNRTFCKKNGGDPDQTQHSVVSDLGLHFLPMSHKKDTRLIWVKSLK